MVIGINVNPKIADEYKFNLINIAMRSFHFMTQTNTVIDSALCDILIELEELQQFTLFDLKNINEIFRLGYDVTVTELETTYKLKRKLPSRLRDLQQPQ